jgi:hypothetical protein
MTGAGVGAIAPAADKEAEPPVGRPSVGGGVAAEVGPPLLPPDDVSRGPGVGPARGFGGNWNGIGSGIFGESFQGMPPRGFAPAGEGVRNSPATAEAGGPGGNIVRAVSSGGSGAAGATATGAGVGARPAEEAGGAAGLTSSLPQPRQNL